MDEVRPFSDTISVDTLIRETEQILASDSKLVGPKNASRIWGFMSKFVMLDRFGKMLGLAEAYPGISRQKNLTLMDTFGGGLKVSFSFLFTLFY